MNDQLTLDDPLAAFTKALGHPARLAILRELAARDTCLCGELVRVLPLAQATVSQHLKVLREAGLVRGEIDGPRSCYCLDADGIRRLRAGLEDLLDVSRRRPGLRVLTPSRPIHL